MTVDYGSDFAGITDLDPALTVVDGLLAFAQSLARRLVQPAGGLTDDPTYGYDIRLELGSTTPVARIQQKAAAELRKDERVDQVSVVAERIGETIELTIGVEPSNGDPPFAFVFDVSKLTVELILSH